MIIFNNLGHTFKEGSADGLPIVWVDSSDTSTYTLSGADVLTLNNKGTLGGAMTLNGTVKFANSGFESASGDNYITRDLGETFLPTNSFTIVTTFDLQNAFSSLQWFSELFSDLNNRLSTLVDGSKIETVGVYSGTVTPLNAVPYFFGVQTLLVSYDVNTNTIIQLNYNNVTSTTSSVVFNNTISTTVTLLKSSYYNAPSGTNNPLHEFRLYDRAFSLTEMQTLQTELNNKYTP